MWKCPECGDTDHLVISVQTSARLIQNDDEFEAEVVGDLEWSPESAMSCCVCGHDGECSGFEAEGEQEWLDTHPERATIQALVEIIDRELMPHIARLPVQRLDTLNETLIAARKLLEGAK